MNSVSDTLMRNMALDYFKKDLEEKVSDTNQAVGQAGREFDPEDTYRPF